MHYIAMQFVQCLLEVKQTTTNLSSGHVFAINTDIWRCGTSANYKTLNSVTMYANETIIGKCTAFNSKL